MGAIISFYKKINLALTLFLYDQYMSIHINLTKQYFNRTFMMKKNPLLSTQITTFITVAEVKSTHAASKLLNISQTAVTKRVKHFEEGLGIPLFSRSHLGMELTDAGKRILHYCYSIKNLGIELLSDLTMETVDNTYDITISGPYSLMKTRVSPAAIQLMKAMPNYNVHLDIHHHDLTEFELNTNQLAIVPITSVSSALNMKPLHPEYYYLFSTSNWKQRSLQDILKNERIIDIDSKDTITLKYLTHFHLLKCTKQPRLFANSTDTLNDMILSGIGYGVINAELKDHSIQSEAICLLNNEHAFESNLAIAWRKCNKIPDHMMRIIDLIE